MGFAKGQKVTLKNTPYYISSDAKNALGKRSGTYYIWSASTKNGRIRITNNKSYCGKEPAGKYVSCWVKTSSLTSATKTTTTTTKKTTTTTKTATATSATSTKNTTTVINIVEASNVTPTTTAQGQIGYLGMVLFIVKADAIRTLDNFVYSVSASYAEHDRHLNTPTLEFTGINSQSITFNIELSAYLGASVFTTFNTLAGYMNTGTAVPMKLGSKTYGNYRWCIKQLSLTGESTDAKGNWTRAKVAVTLISTEKKG